MYDELVKRLRDAAKMSEALSVLLPHSEGNAVAKLHRDAADAIEELSKRVDESIPKDDAEIIIAEVAKPRWIPVTERLPERNNSYLVYVYGEATEMNYWHGKWHRLRDDYTKAVTHWMPLPEPPKEGET